MDFCRLVECANRFVCVELEGVRVGGVYSKSGARVHEMMQWLGGIQASIGTGRWVLIGDWNAHHMRWSLDGRGDSIGRVLYNWMVARGARLVRGMEHTFERRRGNGVVVSRIDFAIAGGGREPGSLVTSWGLSNHSAIGCMMAVEGFEEVVGYRDAVDWLKVQVTVADEHEGWYECLDGDSAYERLLDFRRRHLKKIRICGRSKRSRDTDLTGQVTAVRGTRRNWCRLGHRNVLRADITKMKSMVREKKDRCWRAFCEDFGLQLPYEVVRWARDPWSEKRRMGRLKESNRLWLESD